MSVPQIRVTQNRLAAATSPYLLQHAHNPVDWWQWGPEALAEAKRNNRPILLSVGYAACHWCHVMAHESFEDEATARVMNELFVNIKVDREERPDIDQIYMHALHLLGEQGGWPLTMFLTPAGEPVWGGTYFPKDSRFGRPAFLNVLREVARLFKEEPNKIEQNRAALLERLAEKARPGGKVTVGLPEMDNAARQIGNAFDSVNGGLRGAPKFPQCSILEMLWRAGRRTNDVRFFEIVEHSLARMSNGGIYDHLGGGFSRYSVDERARETVDWLKREMTTPKGALAASLDADSEGEEGKFYVWSKAEIEQVLGVENAAFFAAHYDVSAAGNFEGHNILNRLKVSPRKAEIEGRLAMLRSMLHKRREGRVRPGLDDKVLADWNGLMIAALVNAGIVLDEPSWLMMAQHAFDFISKEMTRGDRLGHSWRAGRLTFPGLATDFASMIRAALALYEATGADSYLALALTWQRAFDTHYADPATGGYYLSADDASDLLLRPHSTADDATPNPNAVAAQNLVRLAVLSGDPQWRTKADRLIESILSAAERNLFGHVALLNALDLRLRAAEIVCTGSGAERFAQSALKLPFTDRIVLRARAAAALSPMHPAQEKIKAAGGSAAFVCVGERCSLPVTEPGKIAEAVGAMRGS